jgi:RND family efflux transporter MFP subunit
MKIYVHTTLAVAILLARAANAAEYDCMIEARQKVDIRSAVEAVIESVLVQRGDLVKKGQVIITLESGPERAALAIAKSRATNVGEIKAAEARVELTRLKLVRAEELFKQNFVSVNALDEAQADIRLATEQLRQAQENQQLAALDVSRVSEVLAMRTIKSPFSGVVVEVMQKPGEFSGSNIKDPILKLAEIDPLNVEVVLPVSLHGQIAVGTRGDVMPEQPIGGKYKAGVSVVDRVVDAASGTFGVRLEMPNRERKIPPGVRCRVKFK